MSSTLALSCSYIWEVGRGGWIVQPRVAVVKQLKDAGSLNSSAIQATEDAEMRRTTDSRRRARHPPRPNYQMKMSWP